MPIQKHVTNLNLCDEKWNNIQWKKEWTKEMIEWKGKTTARLNRINSIQIFKSN